MKMRLVYLALAITISSTLMSYDSIERDKSVEGTWIRKTDNLMVKVDNSNASILQDGDKKFPCDISGYLIYKNIVKVKDNLWTCDFLVVTMGSCAKEYQAGEMFINREGELVIICPGFDTKVYTKVNPRYNASPE
jgi:hypothetical protein